MKIKPKSIAVNMVAGKPGTSGNGGKVLEYKELEEIRSLNDGGLTLRSGGS